MAAAGEASRPPRNGSSGARQRWLADVTRWRLSAEQFQAAAGAAAPPRRHPQVHSGQFIFLPCTDLRARCIVY